MGDHGIPNAQDDVSYNWLYSLIYQSLGMLGFPHTVKETILHDMGVAGRQAITLHPRMGRVEVRGRPKDRYWSLPEKFNSQKRQAN
jgi:hypothetical protein